MLPNDAIHFEDDFNLGRMTVRYEAEFMCHIQYYVVIGSVRSGDQDSTVSLLEEAAAIRSIITRQALDARCHDEGKSEVTADEVTVVLLAEVQDEQDRQLSAVVNCITTLVGGACTHTHARTHVSTHACMHARIHAHTLTQTDSCQQLSTISLR